MVPWDRRGYKRENHIFNVFILKKSSSPDPADQFQSNFVQIILE
jgi:hypothetical protein